MTTTRQRRARLGTVAAGLLTITLVPGLAQLPAIASPVRAAVSASDDLVDTTLVNTLADSVPGLSDLDVRGKVLPSLVQRKAAAKLGPVTMRWNQFGTPESILPTSGVLGSGYSTSPAQAPAAARAWLSQHASLFGLSRAQVAGLTMVNNQEFAQSGARAVLFRQNFGRLSPALDSMITVGVSGGKIMYVSSSATRTSQRQVAAMPAPRLTAARGWLEAAKNVGRNLTQSQVDGIKFKLDRSTGFVNLTVPGFAQSQQARMRSLAMADGTVRPVIEANVVDVQGGSSFAYTLMVDAVSGKILHRQNQVDNNNDVTPFTGSVTATECGVKHPFELTDNNTRSIVGTGAAVNPANDITLKLYDPSGKLLTSSDVGTSPEVLTYTADSISKGIYALQVCPFENPMVPFLPPGNYVASVTTSDQGAPSTGAGTSALGSRWRFFTTNPTPDTAAQTPSNSVIGCWIRGTGCTDPNGPLQNVQAAGPWDVLPQTGMSTFTTIGNNANTHEAWLSPLTPGGLGQAPISPTQDYTTPFTDAWNNSNCNPAELRPGGNDILASVTNLFSGHNKVHDYSYYLGFNERNYNLQLSNLGRGGTQGDQEVGNVQAGAIDGGAPTYMGRDNANQIALQDGVPGITNQYLFQPIAGAFYAPCTDGGLDFGIFGHEYTHAISNRMVGGPDEGITSEQGGAMGESWSDLNAAQLQYSYGYAPLKQAFAVGSYATNNKAVAIRDYSIYDNPLNYSDYGFDSTGPEVHADGEIWNGTQFAVRQGLINKYNAKFPTTNKTLQLKCSMGRRNKGIVRPQKCSGDRRWIQLIYDAFLLQPGATSMLTARDAMLASDMMRFRGDDLKVMWDAFAARGMGKGATTTPDDTDPKSTFASPKSKNAQVTFKTPGSHGNVYVGHYEARVTPAADTTNKTKLKNKLAIVAGKYEMLYTSRTTGFKRFTLNVKAGQKKTVTISAPKNLASIQAGAKVIGSTAGTLNANALIDGTEKSNAALVTADNVDASKPFITVDLVGATQKISRVQVSAYLRPSTGTDADSGSRFTALRQFAIQACTSGCTSPSAKFKTVYTSSAKAFPAVQPRPVAPNLTLRTFKVKPFKASAVRLVVLENQCTGFAGYAGEQDADPTNATDCKTASDRGTIAHASELQLFKK